jgi:hypothetical protein
MKKLLNKVNETSRVFLLAATAACLCAVFLTAQSGGIITKDSKAKEVVDAALKALGGADKIGGAKSFIVKGKGTNAVFSSMNQGPMAKTGSTTNEFEIRILLPDNMFQFEKAAPLPPLPERTTYRVVSGGESMNFLNFPAIPGMPPAKPAASKDQNVVNRQLQEMARLLVGTLMKSGPMPLTVSSGSSPDRFTVTTPGGELCEMEFDARGKYPSILRYKVVDSISKEERDEMMQFQGWASVDGIMFPRVITTKGETMDREMRIENVQINPKLSLKDFEVPKQ